MEMKFKLRYAAVFAALSISVAAIAAEDMGKDMGKNTVMPADKMDRAAQPIKKTIKPHNHNEFNKQGAPAAEKSAAAAEPVKPMHDHGKFHKQQ
jgi:hypothetical protein